MKYQITTLGSHSCLQILKGARDEGFKTLAIAINERVSFYKRFPFIDEVISVAEYSDTYKLAKLLKSKKAIIIPHGSFVAYLGEGYIKNLSVPQFGNKKVLAWEGNRLKQFEWLAQAGLTLPKIYKKGADISEPVIVKLFGAKGGSGYFLAKNRGEFEEKIAKFKNEEYIIQQYIIGTPVYLQYFYSPLEEKIELLGIDRRYETNVDGLSRIPSSFSQNMVLEPSFTVIGNFPLVIRESLLPKVYSMGERIIEVSKKLVGGRGLYGPFCLETILTSDQQFYCIEISCRIVAGTNLYINGSPYSDLIYSEAMSTGRRVAREINNAISQGRLSEILD